MWHVTRLETQHVLILLLGTLLQISQAQAVAQIERRDVDPAWVDQGFYRRGYQSSIILGDYLYLDGGIVDSEDNGSVTRLPVKSTYSIPLSSSWAPEDVQIQRIDKGDYPSYNTPNLWPAVDNSSFFSFNGDFPLENNASDIITTTNPHLWKFAPDGKGSGQWIYILETNSVVQSSNVASTVGNGSAYLLGGLQSWTSTADIAEDSGDIQSADGLVSYEMDTETWSNTSITYAYPSGWTLRAQLYYLSEFGSDGLLLAMGGQTSVPGPQLSDWGVFVDYNTVSIYNTVTNEWRNQTTSGDVPLARGAACSVGVRGDQGTFEVFLHGGYRGTSSQDNINLGQSVYVFSLPSFSWRKVIYPNETARAFHTCKARGRLMLSAGGLSPNGVEGADPRPQGLGIFDLTNMTWKSSYDHAAGPYTTPTQVKDYIKDNGQYPEHWADDVLEQWITGRSTDNSSTSPSPTPTSSSHSSHSSDNTGSIAGGVVGGVVGALLVGFLLWLFIRRRKRRTQERAQAANQGQRGFGPTEIEGNNISPEQRRQVRELQGKPIHEMEGSLGGHEMHTRNR